jgi:serine protease Do
MSDSRESVTRPRGTYVAAIALLLVGIVVGLGLSAGIGIQPAPRAQLQLAASSPAAIATAESPFVAVVDKTLPAVVFIDVRKKVGSSSDDPQDELMRRFFGDGMRRPQTRPSSGSGFIIDRKGHVLTNNHVVRDAQEITVTLNDKRQFKATVVGADPETDVAVIKISGDNLPTIPLGDSDGLRIGDWAIAIGNPLGELKGSVTVGIISAQGRSNLNIFGGTPSFQDFIQTDASINFGNSGGPLVNIRGEAIGINTAINPSGQGIGFAIPINLARHVAEQLVANGSVQRAMIGIQLAELTPELADGFGLKGSDGVLIQDVMPNQAGERAGLKRGDVIVEFEGQPVTDMQKFRLRVAETPVGTKVRLVVLRAGQRVPIQVTLTPRRTDEIAARPSGGRDAEPEGEQLVGVRVRDLTRQELSNLSLESGVMITRVEPGSAAEEAGLQEGDVVEEVGGKAVAGTAGFASLVGDAKKAGKKHAVLLVRRGENATFVPVKIAE